MIAKAEPVDRIVTIGDEPPHVLPNSIGPDECQSLIEHCRAVGPASDGHDDRLLDEGGLRAYDLPAEYRGAMRTYALTLAGLYGLPVDVGHVRARIGHYTTGGCQDWHSDAQPWDRLGKYRTVSFSMLLSEPGVDFEGGEIEFLHPLPQLHKGDLIGFTSRTLHRITPVTKGERFVVICFAECPPRGPRIAAEPLT